MTAKELIETLKALPEDAEVLFVSELDGHGIVSEISADVAEANEAGTVSYLYATDYEQIVLR